MTLPVDYWLGNGLAKHTAVRPKALIEVPVLLDVGAGIRPQQWYRPQRHICLEPFEPYQERLKAAGYEVMAGTADDMIEADAIYLLDVIEHMEHSVGERVIALAQSLARIQVILYTPDGFVEQSEDEWGFGGHYWQTHRSGWTPQDFPGWTIEPYSRGFFASWTPTHN